MSEKAKMCSGAYYNGDDPELVALRLSARLKTALFNQTSIVETQQRTVLIKDLLGTTGKRIYVESDFNCDYGENIHVGENFYANFGCVILDVAPVHIGKNCFMGPQVGIYTATHPIDPVQRSSGIEYAKAIKIGDDCWIGGHATINPGVTIGDNVVVASGAVVTKCVPSNVVVGGNPARIIKEIDVQQ